MGDGSSHSYNMLYLKNYGAFSFAMEYRPINGKLCLRHVTYNIFMLLLTGVSMLIKFSWELLLQTY